MQQLDSIQYLVEKATYKEIERTLGIKIRAGHQVEAIKKSFLWVVSQ